MNKVQSVVQQKTQYPAAYPREGKAGFSLPPNENQTNTPQTQIVPEADVADALSNARKEQMYSEYYANQHNRFTRIPPVSGHAARAIEHYTSNADLEQRQHIVELMGLDVYA